MKKRTMIKGVVVSSFDEAFRAALGLGDCRVAHSEEDIQDADRVRDHVLDYMRANPDEIVELITRG